MKNEKTTRYPNFFSLKMSGSNQLFNEAGLALEKHIIDFKFKTKSIYVKELSEPIILNPIKKYKLTFLECNTSEQFYADILIDNKRIVHFGNDYDRDDSEGNALFTKFQLHTNKNRIPKNISKLTI